ncbi:MAG: trimeric intracellular cation channel family protein [Clostridia bacterium]|nr:trimeric intracellular cation channel family protein [Clostridia bacterium]
MTASLLITAAQIAEYIGTVAFAVSGAMCAIDRELDLFGVLLLGIITATGGGMLRDVILGATPPAAFIDPVYVLTAAIVSLLVFLVAYIRPERYSRTHETVDRRIDIFDAIGLGIFAVTGAEAAMAAGHGDNLFLCVFMGMNTAVGGGILRDILSMRVPMVLVKHVYALAAIIGALAFCLLVRCLPPALAMFLAAGVTFVIRRLAVRFNWNLPKVRQIQNGK